MRIAHVIPLIRLPRAMDGFDYAVPQECIETIRAGTFVAIPFRSSIVAGLVVGMLDGNTTKLKQIIRALPLFYADMRAQWQFFEWFAREYSVSQATALKTLLPAFPKSFLSGKIARRRAESSVPLHEYGDLHLSDCSVIHSDTEAPVTIISPETLQEKWSAYASLIKESLSRNSRIVIIFPTIHDAELFVPVARSNAGDCQTLLFHSGLSEGTLFYRWLELFSSGPACIIGTRMALCAPVHAVDTIIIDQAEGVEHIQHDMNPRFDSRRCATRIGLAACARVFLCSTAPRIEDRALYPIQGSASKHSVPIACVNLHDELRKSSTDIFITEPLIRAIEQCHAAKRGVFLFCNRTGRGSMAICNECGHIYSCPHCAKELKPFSVPPRLSCEDCKFSQPLNARCPRCSSVQIKYAGLGIEKIARTLMRFFPSTPIRELSAHESHAPFAASIHRKDERDAQALTQSIIVGTSYAISACSELFSDCGLVGVIHADPFLSVSDVRLLEHQWQTLAKLKFFAQSFNARMLIQAFDTSSNFIRTFLNNEYASFADAESEQRKRGGWPPYAKSIHLLYRPGARVPPEERRKSINDVIGYFSSPAKDPRCSLFLHRPLRKMKQPTVYEAVIRIARVDGQDDVPPSLREYLAHLPNDWLVDSEPLFF
ncbi:hypothetical protein HY732_05040 [Candidatus Uhrbacteria bacterium]|nr:hypothetical protein [Candidatus Uhrbacteria bacterium]